MGALKRRLRLKRVRTLQERLSMVRESMSYRGSNPMLDKSRRELLGKLREARRDKGDTNG